MHICCVVMQVPPEPAGFCDSYYAVTVGKQIGIYKTRGEAKRQVHRYPDNVHAKFDRWTKACAFIQLVREVLYHKSWISNSMVVVLANQARNVRWKVRHQSQQGREDADAPAFS